MNIKDAIGGLLSAKYGGVRKTPEPIEQMTVQVENFPRLLAIKVQPVLYNGVPTKWKLVFTFDRGDIVIGQSFNQEAMNELRDEIKRDLGMM